MKNLKWLREQGELMNREDEKLLRQLQVNEGIQSFILLYSTFKPQLEATDALFHPEREKYLALLQKRLRQHGVWEKNVAPNLYTSAAKLQKQLANAGFPSAVIGGLAISIWGEPRVTRDAASKSSYTANKPKCSSMRLGQTTQSFMLNRNWQFAVWGLSLFETSSTIALTCS